MTVAITKGIKISVETVYHQSPATANNSQYAFAYRIHIENKSDIPVCLRSRHWIITDCDSTKREVQGEGVVGEQPLILPGMTYQYVSGCTFDYPIGKMHGTYTMENMDDHTFFEVEIPAFIMVVPFLLN